LLHAGDGFQQGQPFGAGGNAIMDDGRLRDARMEPTAHWTLFVMVCEKLRRLDGSSQQRGFTLGELPRHVEVRPW